MTKPIALFCTCLVAAATCAAGPDELPRRKYLGLRLEPIREEERKAAVLPAENLGVWIRGISPGSPADRAGMPTDWILTHIDGVPVRSPEQVNRIVQSHQAGDVLTLDLWQGSRTRTFKLKVEELPRERRNDCQIVYGHVVSRGHRLRTILTRPVPPGRYPAVLFIQGITCSTVDHVPLYQKIFYPLTDAGFVTLRVDKPGVGDSEGGPCEACDFLTELDAYRQALRALKRMDGVDPDRVFLFGHSMGGIFAPLLANEEPVRGVAVFGTGFRTWLEYMLENNRRQALLGGRGPAEVEQMIRRETVVSCELLVAKKTPAQIVADHPGLREYVEAHFADGEHLYGRHYTFYQQLYDTHLAEAWQRVEAPVLALYGEADFLTSAEDHRLIADAVNRAHPGRATFKILPGIDHAFRRASSQADSFRQFSHQVPPGEFNPLIVETLRTWFEQHARRQPPASQP